MITREDINKCQRRNTKDSAVNAIMELIEADQAQYTDLVDAAVEIMPMMEGWKSDTAKKFKKTVQPFIKPLLSEKLDKLATERHGGKLGLVLRQLAAEARILEGLDK